MRALVVLLAAAVLAGCFHASDAPPAPAAADDPADTAPPPAAPRRGDEAPPRAPPTSVDSSLPVEADGPFVVVAHVDTGVNPYHAIFRDASPLAHVHPSKYLAGYPANATALELSLDAASFEEAMELDAAVWAAVEPGRLYWIPGTRIVGAVSFGAGGTLCAATEECADLPILDEHGHGTMTASRSVGAGTSLAPTARFVSVEGLGADSVRWIHEQGWIDVQTNSWGSLVPHPASGAVDGGIAEAFTAAAADMLVLAGSGNGAGFFAGFTPWPTYAQATLARGVVLVGAHDNGKVTHWHGQPPHVVADGYGGLHATRDSFDAVTDDGIACCSSASSPYAAGGAAAIVLEARRILGDGLTGIDHRLVAEGSAGLVADGPLADGNLTLDELRALLFATATPRPVAQVHDGSAQWASGPAPPSDPTQPGGNPYCHGCWTTPIDWAAVPADVPAYASVGYGAVDVPSVTLALAVLRGEAAQPERAHEDEAYALDQHVRSLVYG